MQEATGFLTYLVGVVALGLAAEGVRVAMWGVMLYVVGKKVLRPWQ